MKTEKHSDRAHARYAPSAAYRNSACIGSLLMSEEAERLGIQAGDSVYSKFGTDCHEYASQALALILVGQEYPFARILDPEKREVVESFVAFVGEIFKNFCKTHKGVQYFIEQKVAFDKDFWGTADFMLTGFHNATKKMEMVIIDLKTGKGVEEQAEDNEQLLSYIVCAQAGLSHKIEVAHAFIFQPRTPGKEFTRWTIDFEVINNAANNLLMNKKKVIENAEKGELGKNCTPGEWCRFCNGKQFYQGKPLCTAYGDYVNGSALKVLDKVEPPVFDKLTAEQKFEIFKRRKVLIKIIKEACKDVLILAQKQPFDGYKIVEKNGRRSWKKGNVDVMAKELQNRGFTADPVKKSLVSFGEVEKALGKGKIDDLLQPGNVSYELVPNEDKRIAVQSIGLDDLEDLEFDEE